MQEEDITLPRTKRLKNTISNPCIIDSSSNDSKEENSLSGPTTRKAWSDWCSNKIKVSNSLTNSGQDSNEENGNFGKCLNFLMQIEILNGLYVLVTNS